MSGRQKTAVVTGGTQGIGRATADALADDGWKVISVSRNSGEEITGRTEVLADLSTPEGVDDCTEAILQSADEVDLLVNNAGSIQLEEDALAVSSDSMLSSWQLHVMSPLMLARALLPALRSAPGPSIVNVGSVYGEIADPEVMAYGTSKAGLEYMTRALARKLAPSIRVNAVLPGHVDTQMTRAAPSEFVDEICASTPLGRLSSPEEVAAAILFLASDSAAFVTGSSIRVDGGFTTTK